MKAKADSFHAIWGAVNRQLNRNRFAVFMTSATAPQGARRRGNHVETVALLEAAPWDEGCGLPGAPIPSNAMCRVGAPAL
jgi:hypothetical protein